MGASRICAALLGAVALLAGCGSQDREPAQDSLRSNAASSIWLHPHPADPQYGGSVDFQSLLTSTAGWPTVASHTAVFGLYAGWIVNASDAQIAQLAALLLSQKMSIEIEAPSLQATADCGTNVEGYAPYGQSLQTFTLAYLQRLKAVAADVAFVKVDEPYYFGSVSTEPGACVWPVEQVAAEVAQFAQLVHTVYPNAEVGDTEPIIAAAYAPDVLTALAQWHAAFEAISGSPFPFFMADMDFSDPHWPSRALALADRVRARGMRFGIIYTGDLTDTTDAVWAAKAVARFEAFQGGAHGNPDFALFQSWEPHPLFCLPESEPTSLTGVVAAYIESTGL